MCVAVLCHQSFPASSCGFQQTFRIDKVARIMNEESLSYNESETLDHFSKEHDDEEIVMEPPKSNSIK